MGFNIRELSLWGGKPLGFFRFTRGATVWAYTTADRNIVLDGVTYVPAAIKRSRIKVGPERRKLTITVTVPRDLPVVDNWRPYPPRDRVALTILQQHHGEADTAVDWVGRVLAPKFSGTTVELSCEPSLTSARRAGLSRCWQRACPLALYSQGHGMCNVDKTLHAVPATLTAVNAVTFTSPAFAAVAAGRLAGGYVTYVRAGNGVTEYRTIMAHTGGTITLDYGLDDIAPAMAVTAYPGCRQTFADCVDVFNNGPNFGGDLHLPQKNPHSGNPIW